MGYPFLIRLDGNLLTGSNYKYATLTYAGRQDLGVEEYDCDLAGISALFKAIRTISILSLVDCEIGVYGFSTLAKFIPDSAALSTLNLRDNEAIGATDIEAVKIAAPNVSIEH